MSATEIYVVTELPRLSVARDQPDLAALLEGTWRLLSGFEHGFGWACCAAPIAAPKRTSPAV